MYTYDDRDKKVVDRTIGEYRRQRMGWQWLVVLAMGMNLVTVAVVIWMAVSHG